MSYDVDVENGSQCFDAITAAACYLDSESDSPENLKDDIGSILDQAALLHSLAMEMYVKVVPHLPSTQPVKESSDNE